MNLDLSSILSAITSQNTTLRTAIQELTGIGESRQQVRDSMTSDITRSGEAAAIEESASGLGALSAQQNARKAASALGSNMDLSSEVITALGMRVRDASMSALETLDTIKRKEKVGLLDNPIEFIMNQVSLGSDYSNYNLAVEEHNQASSALGAINTATSQSAAAQLAIAQTVTEASIAAKVERTRLAANLIAKENQIRGFADNQDNIAKTIQLEGQQLQNHLAARQVYQDERNFDMRQQEFASSQKAQAVNLARMEKELNKDTLDEQDQVMITTAINVARSQMGLGQVQPREVQRILKLGGAVAEDLRSQYLIGASSVSTNKAIISTSPAEALAILNRNKGKLKSSKLNEFIRGIPDLAQSKDPLAFQSLEPAKQVKLIDSLARTEARTQQDWIKAGDSTNIYQLPDAATILSSAGLSKSDLYSKVLKPVLDTQQDKTLDPAKIISLTAAAIAAKTVKFETVAAELDTYFAQAKVLNNDFNDYEQIGLPNQKQVNVKLNEGLLNNPVRDVSNPAQLRVHLMKEGSFKYRLQRDLIESGTVTGAARLLGKFPPPKGE